MKILVTGSSGQLGLCLFDKLDQTNHEVFFASKLDLNISKFDEINKFINNFKPDLIINAAAYTAVDLAEDEHDKADLINNLAVENLAKICQKLNIKLIHISTDYVFNGSSKTPYVETDECCPINIYGLSKYKGECAIIRSGCEYIIIRTSWVFSEYGNNFVKTMLNLGQKMETLNIVNDQFGCPTYAHDIALFIKKLIEKPSNRSLIINFCGNKMCSWFDFAKEIFKIAEINKIKVPKSILGVGSDQYKFKAPRPKFSVLSTKLAYEIFEIQPSNWQKGLQHVVLKYKSGISR